MISKDDIVLISDDFEETRMMIQALNKASEVIRSLRAKVFASPKTVICDKI